MLAATYAYDAWGNVIAGSDYSGMNIRAINPIRYRSYYFDNETGLYYLNSRYYDPETGRFINADNTKYLDPETLGGLSLYAYCLNNPVNMNDLIGCWPEWISNVLKVAAGVAVVAAGVVLTTVTFGAAAPLSVVVTAAVIGTVAGAATNAASQYLENGSWDNFQIDECIFAGVTGGLSAILATTPIGIGGQIVGNAMLSGINSFLNGNSADEVLLDAGIGALAGFAGGPGTGSGGLVMSEALRYNKLMNSFIKGFVKSSVVSNARNIFNCVKQTAEEYVD